MEAGIVDDGCLAQDQKQMRSLWQIRESIAESMGKRGAVYKYDLSIPHHRMYSIVDAMKQRIRSVPKFADIDVIGYGHLGDGTSATDHTRNTAS